MNSKLQPLRTTFCNRYRLPKSYAGLLLYHNIKVVIPQCQPCCLPQYIPDHKNFRNFGIRFLVVVVVVACVWGGRDINGGMKPGGHCNLFLQTLTKWF